MSDQGQEGNPKAIRVVENSPHDWRPTVSYVATGAIAAYALTNAPMFLIVLAFFGGFVVGVTGSGDARKP